MNNTTSWEMVVRSVCGVCGGPWDRPTRPNLNRPTSICDGCFDEWQTTEDVKQETRKEKKQTLQENYKKVLNFFRQHNEECCDEPLRRVDILEAVGIPSSDWIKISAMLIERGFIRKEGKKKGTKYFLTEAGE
jgi:predicted transcriptional regulator